MTKQWQAMIDLALLLGGLTVAATALVMGILYAFVWVWECVA